MDNSLFCQGILKVSHNPEPEGQKFKCGSRVHVSADLGPSMSHFKSDCDATVMYTHAHAYGGGRVKSYCLEIDGNKGTSSWYEESQLTQINLGQSPKKENKMVSILDKMQQVSQMPKNIQFIALWEYKGNLWTKNLMYVDGVLCEYNEARDCNRGLDMEHWEPVAFRLHESAGYFVNKSEVVACTYHFGIDKDSPDNDILGNFLVCELPTGTVQLYITSPDVMAICSKLLDRKKMWLTREVLSKLANKSMERTDSVLDKITGFINS